MVVAGKISSAEMREALRMNLTSAFWWRAAMGNRRGIVAMLIFAALLFGKLTGRGPVEWSTVAVLFGAVLFFFAIYLFRLHRIVEKSTKTLNESCSNMTIDGKGLTTETPNGSRTFVPWSAMKRWREGKLVFTVGDGKSFRTIPKSTLGEMQSGELRSLLLSQIQTPSLGR
jgi:hypothetical protein